MVKTIVWKNSDVLFPFCDDICLKELMKTCRAFQRWIPSREGRGYPLTVIKNHPLAKRHGKKETPELTKIDQVFQSTFFFLSVAPFFTPLDFKELLFVNKAFYLKMSSKSNFWKNLAKRYIPYSFLNHEKINSFLDYTISSCVKSLMKKQIDDIARYKTFTFHFVIKYLHDSVSGREVVVDTMGNIFIDKVFFNRWQISSDPLYILIDNYLLRTSMANEKMRLDILDLSHQAFAMPIILDSLGLLLHLKKKSSHVVVLTEKVNHPYDIVQREINFISREVLEICDYKFVMSLPRGEIRFTDSSAEHYHYFNQNLSTTILLESSIREDILDFPCLSLDNHFALSPNEDLLASPTLKGGVVIWDLATGKIVKYVSPSFEECQKYFNTIIDEEENSYSRPRMTGSICFLSQGLILMSVENSSNYHVFDLNEGKWQLFALDNDYLDSPKIITAGEKILFWDEGCLMQTRYLQKAFHFLPKTEQARLAFKAFAETSKLQCPEE